MRTLRPGDRVPDDFVQHFSERDAYELQAQLNRDAFMRPQPWRPADAYVPPPRHTVGGVVIYYPRSLGFPTRPPHPWSPYV